MRRRPDRLPGRVRLAAYASATTVLLYLTLAPSRSLPQETLWDKAEHALAWLLLTALGLAFWPRRPARVAAFAVALGGLVEILQAALPFGRSGDVRDLIADVAGVAAAVALWAVLRRPAED